MNIETGVLHRFFDAINFKVMEAITINSDSQIVRIESRGSPWRVPIEESLTSRLRSSKDADNRPKELVRPKNSLKTRLQSSYP